MSTHTYIQRDKWTIRKMRTINVQVLNCMSPFCWHWDVQTFDIHRVDCEIPSPTHTLKEVYTDQSPYKFQRVDIKCIALDVTVTHINCIGSERYHQQLSSQWAYIDSRNITSATSPWHFKVDMLSQGVQMSDEQCKKEHCQLRINI